MKQSQAKIALFALLALLVAPAAGICNDAVALAQQDITTTTGVVTSSSPNTLVVKTASGQYILFVYGDQSAEAGTYSRRLDRDRSFHSWGRRNTRSAEGHPRFCGAAQSPPAPPPRSPRQHRLLTPGWPQCRTASTKVESGIDKQIKRFGLGLDGGVGLDPEVILVGINARFGPIFSKDVTFRPSADFGFGEVTKMFQINLDVAYRLPITARNSPWTAYAGAGPNFSFVSQNFTAAEEGDQSVDFSDLNFKAGLNVNVGMEHRDGLYFEMKAGVWTIPTLRLMVGYHF